MNPHIEDHKEWMMSYTLSNYDKQALDAFYDAWQESGTLPDLANYLNIDSIIL